MSTTKRCEVLWAVRTRGKIRRYVSKWLPAELIGRDPIAGKCEVRTDCGKHTDQAAPECVREVQS